MFQQIILIGNLGSEVESRKTPSGQQVASFRMAVNKSWTGQDGQKQEKATWFRVSAWGKLAEIVSLYATKGRQVMVIGEIEDPNVYTNKAGESAANLEVTARTFKLLGGRGDDNNPVATQAAEQPTRKSPFDEGEIPF